MVFARLTSALLTVGFFCEAAAAPPASASATLASSSEVDPAVKLRRTDAALRQLLRRNLPEWSPEASAQRLEAARLLENLFDTQEMARLALDERWETLPEAQRVDFVRTLAELARQAFLDRLAARRGNEIRYQAATVDGAEARVPAEMSSARPDPNAARYRARLEYRLALKNGRWMVYDLVVDGVSLVASYRAEFARFLKNEPFDALLVRMKRKLGSL